MSDTTTATTADTTVTQGTTTTADATTTASTATAATTDNKGGGESLLAKPGTEAKPDAKTTDATAGEHAWLPEKFRVIGQDGQLDLAASSKKLSESYGNLERHKGEPVPENPDAYTYTPPEQFKDMPLDDDLSKGFRERAHAAGLTQKQYEFVMGEYFGLVPQVLDSAAKLSAAEAKTELSKVWKTQAELEAGVSAASRAIGMAPEAIRENVWVKFGRDPDFIQFAAAFGKEMQEDRSVTSGGAVADDITALLSHPAVSDPKHPEHAKISKQISDHFAKKHGNQAALQ